VQVGNTVVEGRPKTDRSRRAVHLDEQLVAELRGHRARQLEERLAAGPAWNDTGFLFVDSLGHPLSPRAFSLRFGSLIKMAGLRRIRQHDGRHTAATMLLGMGVPVHEVSAILGHSKSSVTLDVYAHAIPGVGAEAGTRLTALLANPAQRALS
jgi:integrase